MQVFHIGQVDQYFARKLAERVQIAADHLQLEGAGVDPATSPKYLLLQEAAARAGVVAAEAAPVRTTGAAATPGKGGDVIVSIDGRETKTFVDLARAIDNTEVGKSVTITVLRNGQRMNLTAQLQPWDLRAN